MANRLLRHKPSGVLYVYQPVFAENPDFEEVIDVESRVVETPPKRKARKAAEPPIALADEELGEQAARGLP